MRPESNEYQKLRRPPDSGPGMRQRASYDVKLLASVTQVLAVPCQQLASWLPGSTM
jgi:hypothetical protein